MRKLYASFIIILLSIVSASGQYKFDYKLKLHDKSSTYSESNVVLPDTSQNAIVIFDVENSTEQKLNFINVTVKGKKFDYNTKTDSTGKAIIKLKPGVYTFSVSSSGYTPLELKDITLTNTSQTKYSVNLGEVNAQKTAKLRCSKKLSDKQIEGILRDLTKGKTDSELIRCRICFLSFE